MRIAFCNGLYGLILIALPEQRTSQLPSSLELPESVTAMIDPVQFVHSRLMLPEGCTPRNPLSAMHRTTLRIH